MTKNIKQMTEVALKVLEKSTNLTEMKRCPICKGKLEPKSSFYHCIKCNNDFFTMSNGKVFIWDREAGKLMPRSKMPSGDWVEFNPNAKVKVTFT
jgi:anaerobic ribonucleoside-triphosphate reductase